MVSFSEVECLVELKMPGLPAATADWPGPSPDTARGPGSVEDVPGRPVLVTPGRGAAWLAVWAALAYVALAVLVEVDLTRSLDLAVREYFRPDDVWGQTQVRVDVVVEGLKPARVVAVAGVLVTLLSVYRRSWRYAAYGVTVLGSTSMTALATKVLVSRTDPHDKMSSVGSFPSGHVLVLLVCLGGLLLLAYDRPDWWKWWPVAAIDAAMAVSLLLQAAHWFTDVIGAVLLGVAVLAATSRCRWRRVPSATDPVPEPGRRRS